MLKRYYIPTTESIVLTPDAKLLSPSDNAGSGMLDTGTDKAPVGGPSAIPGRCM